MRIFQGLYTLLTIAFMHMAFLGNTLAQQGHMVAGKVTNEAGSPVAGVSVLESGTKNGTTTDEKGEFMLKVSKTSARLQISYVGYAQQVVQVNAVGHKGRFSMPYARGKYPYSIKDRNPHNTHHKCRRMRN